MASKRIEFVDVAKGIATILVIIGHLSYTPVMIKIWLYTFHIPLFFFLSGFVLNTHKYQNVKEFTLDKLKKSILPYIYLSMITWIFVECINQPITQIGIDSVKKFLGIFICAKGTSYYLTLWFIISLFFAQIIVYLLSRLNSNKKMLGGLTLLFIVGVGISQIYQPGWIFVSDTVPMASVFVGMGYLVRKHFSVFKKLFKIQYMIIFFVLNFVFGFLNLNGIDRVDLYYQNLGNPILYLLSAICGIYMISIFSQYIRNVRLLQYIGMNSLIFYAFHRPIFIPIADRLVDMLVDFQFPYISHGSIKMTIALIFICMGLCILTEIVNRYFPFILGKKKICL